MKWILVLLQLICTGMRVPIGEGFQKVKRISRICRGLNNKLPSVLVALVVVGLKDKRWHLGFTILVNGGLFFLFKISLQNH
jgi:hypothetical protein